MNDNTLFDLTNTTKKACLCSASSILFILLFIISPLRHSFFLSNFMKIIVVLLLIYTIYLNFIQIQYLRNTSSLQQTPEISSQLSINIICNYVFILFIGLLLFFVITPK
jgi:hypothetical protein